MRERLSRRLRRAEPSVGPATGGYIVFGKNLVEIKSLGYEVNKYKCNNWLGGSHGNAIVLVLGMNYINLCKRFAIGNESIFNISVYTHEFVK